MLNTKLYSLLAVAETLNLTQAATKTGFTQPAISQHIKALEVEFGVKLFTRKDTGIKLTKEGEIAVKYAEKILGVYEKLKQDLSKDVITKTKINLGIDEVALPKKVLEHILKLVNVDTKYEIKLVFDDVKNLYNLLDNDEIDLLISNSNPASNYSEVILASNPVLILTASNDKKQVLSLKDLYDTPFILNNDKSRGIFLSALKNNGVNVKKLKIVAESSTPSTSINLANAGLGYAVLFESDYQAENSSGLLNKVVIDGVNLLSSVYAVFKNDFKLNDFIQTLTAFIK
jgi:DNA-binding transcriptional LysR family regulator